MEWVEDGVMYGKEYLSALDEREAIEAVEEIIERTEHPVDLRRALAQKWEAQRGMRQMQRMRQPGGGVVAQLRMADFGEIVTRS